MVRVARTPGAVRSRWGSPLQCGGRLWLSRIPGPSSFSCRLGYPVQQPIESGLEVLVGGPGAEVRRERVNLGEVVRRQGAQAAQVAALVGVGARALLDGESEGVALEGRDRGDGGVGAEPSATQSGEHVFDGAHRPGRADGLGGEDRDQPGVREQRAVNREEYRAQLDLPRGAGLGHDGQCVKGFVDEPVENFVAGSNPAVETHGRDAELIGHAAHG